MLMFLLSRELLLHISVCGKQWWILVPGLELGARTGAHLGLLQDQSFPGSHSAVFPARKFLDVQVSWACFSASSGTVTATPQYAKGFY